jgi:hypothetical protein
MMGARVPYKKEARWARLRGSEPQGLRKVKYLNTLLD